MREIPNRILDFLTATAKPPGDACRSNPRRRSSARVELSWLDGNAWRKIPARLRDISRGGAGLVARSAPPSAGTLRLRIVDEEGSPWIEANILGIERESPTRHHIRLRFAIPCPSHLLRLAILESVEPASEPQGWVTWNAVGLE